MTTIGYPVAANEEERLRGIERLAVETEDKNGQLHEILELSTKVLDVPAGMISIVGEKEQRILCEIGSGITTIDRGTAICGYTIAGGKTLIINDTKEDERFKKNPMVLGGPKIRFYAGAPLQTRKNLNIGTICMLDKIPHHWDITKEWELEKFASIVMNELTWRHQQNLCPITGLHQEKMLLLLGEKELERCRTKKESLSILKLDIDNFVQINQRWGHKTGDWVLKDFCRLCQNQAREEDLICRLDDESFGLLLVGRTIDEAVIIGEEIRQATERMLGVFSRIGYRIHVSGGASSLSDYDRDFTDLFERSKRALYIAKSNGRNQIASLVIREKRFKLAETG
jgi:diguanylate cyclase (GGDEF)-like protein